MPAHGKYYVIEYRYAIQIKDANNVMSAVAKANEIAEQKFGFRPKNWFARIFEYFGGPDETGPSNEYFYNPHSVSYRKVDTNWESHQELIKNGEEPNAS
ncbi:MAG: hypothetical protein CL612_05455 [Anaerolineaceae bacterium]|jgi:hypothetical protein|nr:hypothetical protein [Anaerolineaceae bacterium]|tara:strand:- start:7614 stop:7910 length:297 start_codon:yes stop_codon:yes gene_type:complete